jgi:hypothetical protein
VLILPEVAAEHDQLQLVRDLLCVRQRERVRLLKRRQISQIRTNLACTRIRRMALAASDDDQQKVKEDIRRYFHGRFHREDAVFRDFRSKHYRRKPLSRSAPRCHVVELEN